MGPPCINMYGVPDPSVPRTYVVFGMPRGGTSLIGGMARLCGLPFGDDLRGNHEDPILNYDNYVRQGVAPVPAIRDAILRRNNEHEVWGWKYPRAIRYLDKVRTDLRNPHLILVMRDPVAAAGRHGRAQGGRATAVRYQHQLQSANIDLVERWAVPTLLVSYERGSQRPMQLARQLADFLGLPRPADRKLVRSFAQRGTYQRIE